MEIANIQCFSRGTSPFATKIPKSRLHVRACHVRACAVRFVITCGHFQQTVSFGVQRPLELEHVVILFRVHVIIREEDIQAVEIEPHGLKS